MYFYICFCIILFLICYLHFAFLLTFLVLNANGGTLIWTYDTAEVSQLSLQQQIFIYCKIYMYIIVYLYVWLHKSPTFSQSQSFYRSHLINIICSYLYQKKYVVTLHFFRTKILASVMTSVCCLFTGSVLPPWGSWWVELRAGQCTTPEQAQLRRLKTRVARSLHWPADWLTAALHFIPIPHPQTMHLHELIKNMPIYSIICELWDWPPSLLHSLEQGCHTEFAIYFILKGMFLFRRYCKDFKSHVMLS